MTDLYELDVWCAGRPAPQGSKRMGQAGQMREASPYLPAWRAALTVAVYRRYERLGIPPEDLPLFRGAVSFGVTFFLDTGQRVDAPPDLDKLIRAVWDVLTRARVWEDDARVTEILWATKVAATQQEPVGAALHVKGHR